MGIAGLLAWRGAAQEFLRRSDALMGNPKTKAQTRVRVNGAVFITAAL